MRVGSELVQTLLRRRKPVLNAALEKLGFVKDALKSRSRNAAFRERHPDFPLPPLYLLWDAQSHTDYQKYKSSGEEAAVLYWELIRAHLAPGSAARRVCEWGCGPDRIIRHLPGLSRGHSCAVHFYGTDYNRRSIDWCQRHLREVTFKANRLAPPLDFEDGFFDVLFCRSVFTHLSEEMHYAWIRELSRVVKPEGVLMISTQGQAHRGRLLEAEKVRFDRGELVIRELAKEGKLSFSAFQPSQFVREQLLSGFQILEYREGQGTQDIWIVRNASLNRLPSLA